jgi:phosphoglycerate kinase
LAKKTIRDIELSGKHVIIRCDFNVPFDGDGNISDTTRIEGALPSISYILEQGASMIIMSHLGRPKGEPKPELSLKPVATELSKRLGLEVWFKSVPEVIDDEVRTHALGLKPGEIMLLENTRFRIEDEKNGADFAKELASLADIYVNDAFGTAHRAHASTAGIADYIPAVSGFLIEKEVRYLGDALNSPKRPFIAVLGGSKVGDKIKVIDSLLKKVDTLLIGGGMAFTFFKAQGKEIGTSILDADSLDVALEVLEKAKSLGVELLLPVDVNAGKSFDNDTESAYFDVDSIPSDFMGLDIGPKTIEIYQDKLIQAGTVLWNGPMGVFEMPNFATGTRAVAEALANSDAISIIGGGDSAAAVTQFGLDDKMTHVSTGGGASLEFIEDGSLVCIDVLEDM